ncbi:MAG: UDP-N-acetylmuramate--L-alanine ligase [Proteobacteria bacterium]|nr:MAG: UDP-N-acetylmuramate--L-alanine ligase [Pseudomonadota bacterium]
MREFVHHVHFVGIGGAGMSGIAEVLLGQGYRVTGSDLNDSDTVHRLRRAGAVVDIGHAAGHVAGADVVVVSSAIAESNVEAVAARAAGIPVIPRAEMLGELMRFGQGIAVAGTHGKTTTTSLVAAVLAQAGLDPTFVVGGLVNSIDSNARLGKGACLVAEADESDASFLHLQPLISVVTNIDADHMEAYGGDFARLQRTFSDFIQNLPFYGLAILCLDDPVVRDLAAEVHRTVVGYGTGADAGFRAHDISQSGTTMKFSVTRPGRDAPLSIELALPGFHNVLNATAAIAVAHHLKVKDDDIRRALKEFSGIGRRMQQLGALDFHGKRVDIVDDYAHHPREIRATLDAARGAWPDRRIVVVFQPHRYSRTQNLFDDFAELLSGVEPLVVGEVYPAGEAPISADAGRARCRAIRRRGATDPVFVDSLDRLAEVLEGICQHGDIVLMLGAGDIGRHARRLAGGADRGEARR